MRRSQLVGLKWRKATASQGYANCVEVAKLGSSIAVRDSKDRNGPILVFDATDWAGFTAGAKRGELTPR